VARAPSDSFRFGARYAIKARPRDKNLSLITKKNSIAICPVQALSRDVVTATARALVAWRARSARRRHRCASNYATRSESRSGLENMALAMMSDCGAKTDVAIGRALLDSVSAARAGRRCAITRSKLIAMRA